MRKSLITPVIVSIVFISTLFSCDALRISPGTSQNSVFSNNAILADQNYYTRAVMEYYLVNDLIARFGHVTVGRDPDDPINTDWSGNLQKIQIETDDSTNIKCTYKRPETLEDLESGFQFRYYLFTGEARASMQAFGITDIDASNETTYLVIDYIQFKDIKCSRLPKIRYAVGLRSELKINYVSSEFEFQGAQSLKNLAAQVELDQAEVFFSLKTIGITGFDARFNIPQGVSFDVTTYKDFQNSIEFIKTKLETLDQFAENIDKDSTTESIGERAISIIDQSRVHISPEIIPVLDDYRPNLRSSLRPLVGEIKGLSRERRRINRANDNLITPEIKEKLNKLIDDEISSIVEERQNYDSLNKILSINLGMAIATNTNDADKKEFEETFADAFPHLDTLDEEFIGVLGSIYLYSDGITTPGYERFLYRLDAVIIDGNKLTDAQLGDVINFLAEKAYADEATDRLLDQVATALETSGNINSLKE